MTRRSFPALLLLAAWLLPSGLSRTVAAGNEGPALIHGIIYRADEVTRLAGAQVTAINVRTGRRYSSVYTGTNGAYEIAGLPAGTYDIAIDTPDSNLYVTDGLIDLSGNQRLLLSLSLKRKGGAAPGAPSTGGATPIFTDPGEAPPAAPLESPGVTGPAPDATPAPEGKKSSKSSGKKPKKSGSKPSTGSGATAMLAHPDSPPSLS